MKIKAYLFFTAFWGLFFLPYLGNTQFRVDQIMGAFALFVAGFAIFNRPLSDVSRDMTILIVWSILILVWAFIATFASPGTLIIGLKFVNTFSYFAEGASLFLIFRYRLLEQYEEFFDVMLFYSIVVNVIGVVMWLDPHGSTALSIVSHYGGITDKTNYEFGNIAGDSLNAGRISSIFPHSQALGTYNLLVYAISYSILYASPSVWRKGFAFVALVGSVVGGLMTASKTYFLGFGIILSLQMIFGLFEFIKRPRLSIPFVLTTGAFGIAAGSIYQYSRFIRDHIDIIVSGNLMTILEPRFGKDGYLVTTNTIREMWKPVNFLLGMGRVINSYAWSDNGFIQIVTFGGIFFFFFFYAYIFNLMYTFYRSQTSIYQRMILFFFVAEFCANTGTLIYLFPRTALITSVVVCVVLAMAERDLAGAQYADA